MILNNEIIYCKYCNSIKIKDVVNKNTIRYICLDCGKQSSSNTVVTRTISDKDFKIYDLETIDDDKLELFDFLFKNVSSKNKFLNRKNKDKSLERWLYINNIIINDIDITVENIFDYCKSLTFNDIKCKNPNCNNIPPFIGIHQRYPLGRKHVCCDKCMNEYRSYLQKGENNTCYRMTEKTKKEANLKISKKIKQKIQDGSFTPNITNSWSKSMCILNSGKKYRSTWEAFFQLVNDNLEYEKIRIPYTLNEEKHIYIVDFVDYKNRLLYEIKPNSERNKKKNKIKEEYAKKWCKENNYAYKIISNKWFENNYNIYKHLIKNQTDENKMLKNLRQFE